jgi:hypothetical protein
LRLLSSQCLLSTVLIPDIILKNFLRVYIVVCFVIFFFGLSYISLIAFLLSLLPCVRSSLSLKNIQLEVEKAFLTSLYVFQQMHFIYGDVGRDISLSSSQIPSITKGSEQRRQTDFLFFLGMCPYNITSPPFCILLFCMCQMRCKIN